MIRSRSVLLLAASALALVAACQEDEAEGTTEETGEIVAPEDGEMSVGEIDSQELEEAATDVGDASADATEAARDAAQSNEAPSVAAQDEATDAAEEAGTVGAAAEDVDPALTVEGFDADRAIARIEQSGLDAVRQSTLIESLRTAPDDPDALAPILERVRGAIGEVGLEGGPAAPE